MDSKQLPIGYYIKKADDLLTRKIDEIQASLDMTRTDWQVLHSIYEEGQLDEATLAILLKPFATGDALSRVVVGLKEAGLVKTKAEALVLTELGSARHNACLQKQQAFRTQLMSGISKQEYDQAILTLQKMIDNIHAV